MSDVNRWDQLVAKARREVDVPASPPPGFAFAVMSRAAAVRRDAESGDVVRMIFRGAIAASIVAVLVGAWNWRAVAGELGVAESRGPDQVVDVSVEPGL